MSDSGTVELAYERRGPAGATPIVFLGSLGSDRAMWLPQVSGLSADHDTVAVDLRGHGESPVPTGPYTVSQLAGDVAALLGRLGIESAHVVGLSLGGAVAQQLAIDHPGPVRSLTLLCTSARFGEPAGWTDRAAAVRADGTGSIAAAVVGRWFTAALAHRDPPLVERMREMVTGTPDEGYAACCEALAVFDSRADLGRITVPTLVIGAIEDPATPPEHQRLLADGIVGARLRVLDHAAHLASYEQAGAVTAAIREHVDGAEQRSVAYATGMRNRRSVLGDTHVDRAVAKTTPLTAIFQDFITRTAWGDVWERPGLDHETRRLLTIAILTAVGNEHELDMHIRAALRAGMDADRIAEVLLHTAVYAGVPNSNRGFAMTAAAVADLAAQAALDAQTAAAQATG
ncbi:bifunctional 3-oxoadipate enol-lactonase/4-carboxymuconolactone decarboxylase PcaDC [Tsukamurella soli]|uniref:3-oxoadipate enol-lactonase n=1 Tax=Tsukamurella soli TaxID=644556 RepID=A0ABP8KC15_9ACTN